MRNFLAQKKIVGSINRNSSNNSQNQGRKLQILKFQTDISIQNLTERISKTAQLSQRVGYHNRNQNSEQILPKLNLNKI